MQNKRIPLRTCVSCRENKDKRELLRIVRTPEGEILADESGRLNGRGAYVCRNKECIERLKKSHGLDRSFKMSVPDSFFETLLGEFTDEE